MIDYTFHGVKVALIRKIKNRESEAENPIYWRITYQRKQAYYFTGLKFDEKEWDDFLKRKMQKHRKHSVNSVFFLKFSCFLQAFFQKLVKHSETSWSF